MSPEILSGTEIEKAFKKALEDREFSVWYQPQVDMRTGGIRGAEALVRWQKKNGEMILPDLFVPVLEKRGLMPLLDEEVLRIVCGDIRDMKHRKASFCPVSVNLSRMHAGRREIMGVFREITEEYGIRERCLPIRKHREAREKRYSFGYAVFLILALMK